MLITRLPTLDHVLSQPWVHDGDGSVRDVRAWLSRGWCRTEVTANALSLKAKSVIVCQSPTDLVSHGPGGLIGRNWISATVGQGNFSVASDREPVGQVLSRLLDHRAAAGFTQGTAEGLIISRALRAISSHLLTGLGSAAKDVSRPKDAEAFMHELGFSSITDGADTGWTPLRLAVMAGRLDLAEELLDLGSDIESPSKSTIIIVATATGTTILHVASFIRDDAPMVNMLLKRGANPRLRAGRANLTALHYACSYGRTANIDALLAHDPGLASLPTLSPIAALLPLTLTSSMGHPEVLRHVLKTYPQHVPKTGELCPVGPGMAQNWCTSTTNGIGDAECLKILIDHGSVHEKIGGKQTHGKLLFGIADVMVRLKKDPKSLFVQLALANRCSALHAAALNGNVSSVKLLLERTPAVVNSTEHSHSATPLHLAAYNDHQSIVVILLEAGADAGAFDRRKRTPAQWAKRRGYADLAMKLQRAADSAKGSN